MKHFIGCDVHTRNQVVAWIEEDFSLYPCALPQHGVEMERVLFVESGGESLWSAHQILRSGLFEVVVLNAWVEEEVMIWIHSKIGDVAV